MFADQKANAGKPKNAMAAMKNMSVANVSQAVGEACVTEMRGREGQARPQRRRGAKKLTPSDVRLMEVAAGRAGAQSGKRWIVVAWFAPRAALYMWAMIPPIIILQVRGLSRPSTIRVRSGGADLHTG